MEQRLKEQSDTSREELVSAEIRADEETEQVTALSKMMTQLQLQVSLAREEQETRQSRLKDADSQLQEEVQCCWTAQSGSELAAMQVSRLQSDTSAAKQRAQSLEDQLRTASAQHLLEISNERSCVSTLRHSLSEMKFQVAHAQQEREAIQRRLEETELAAQSEASQHSETKHLCEQTASALRLLRIDEACIPFRGNSRFCPARGGQDEGVATGTCGNGRRATGLARTVV